MARGDNEDALEYFEDYLKLDIPPEEADKIKPVTEKLRNGK